MVAEQQACLYGIVNAVGMKGWLAVVLCAPRRELRRSNFEAPINYKQ